MKLVDFILLILTISISTFKAKATTDSLFVEFHSDKGRIMIYTIQPGETIYALARSFGTSARAIEHYNPSLRRNKRQVYKQIFIPLHDQAIVYRIPLFRKKRNLIPIYYKVKPKDNLFRISRVYFRLPTALLESRNKIENNEISIGQVLHIGWLKAKEEDLEVTVGEKVEDPKLLMELEFFDQGESEDFFDKKTISIKDENSSTPGLFVLHNTAKTGSIIQVLNPMLGTVAYGKVMGKVPKSLYSKEIEMIISSEMADKLGVMDKRAFLSTKYVK